MKKEQYVDAYGKQIAVGIYVSRDSGAYYEVQKKREKLFFIDPAVSTTKRFYLSGSQHLLSKLRPIKDPKAEAKRLRKVASLLEKV